MSEFMFKRWGTNFKWLDDVECKDLLYEIIIAI